MRQFPYVCIFLFLFIATEIQGQQRTRQNPEGSESMVSDQEKQELAMAAKEALGQMGSDEEARAILSLAMYKEYRIAKTNLQKMTEASSLNSREFISIYSELEKSASKIAEMSMKDTSVSCPGECHQENGQCKKDCAETGKKYCGCNAVTIACGFCCFLCKK
jgi:hypothetical protein